MFQSVNCDLLFYTDDSCLVYQHRISKKLSKNWQKFMINLLIINYQPTES